MIWTSTKNLNYEHDEFVFKAASYSTVIEDQWKMFLLYGDDLKVGMHNIINTISVLSDNSL